MDYKEKIIALLDSKELSQEQKEKLELIFPELKESEDERIRKSLITFFQCFPYERIETAGTNPEEAITWLEKQGKTLDPDKVIEWLDGHVPTKFEDMQNYVQQFKKDFGL